MICPCKDCNDRFVGCHSVCNDYKKWSAEKTALKEIKYKQNQLQNDLIEYKNKSLGRHTYR